MVIFEHGERLLVKRMSYIKDGWLFVFLHIECVVQENMEMKNSYL